MIQLEDPKAFWRMSRACLWTAILVVAALFFLKILDPAALFIPQWMVVLFYAAALWVLLFKLVRLRIG